MRNNKRIDTKLSSVMMALRELAPYALDGGATMDTSTPLFYYVLKEAEVMEQGLRLARGRANRGEVCIGLLREDPGSSLRAAPGWKPTLPASAAGDFRMSDLLRFAGVVAPL